MAVAASTCVSHRAAPGGTTWYSVPTASTPPYAGWCSDPRRTTSGTSVSTSPSPTTPARRDSEGANWIYNVPRRMAGIFRYKGKAVAVFQFRSEPIDYDHHDLDAQKKILIDAFEGYRTWRIPELLDVARADPGFYFTSASQIHLPSWHRGRLVLVGDAGYSPAFLSGRGTSLALTGARFLAEELERCGNDHAAAFARYEARQRPYVTFAQDRVHSGRDRMLPTTWAAIAARNRALRASGAGARRCHRPRRDHDRHSIPPTYAGQRPMGHSPGPHSRGPHPRRAGDNT